MLVRVAPLCQRVPEDVEIAAIDDGFFDGNPVAKRKALSDCGYLTSDYVYSGIRSCADPMGSRTLL